MKYCIMLTFGLVCLSQPVFSQAKSYTYAQNTVVFENAGGEQLRMEFYENSVVRVRKPAVPSQYLPDQYYPFIPDHQKTGDYYISESDDGWIAYVKSNKGEQFAITIDKRSLLLSWRCMSLDRIILKERDSKVQNRVEFEYDKAEHFCGMGHRAFGLVDKLDLRGKEVSCNYGEGVVDDWGAQGVLTVPFFMSSNGYGIFLNSSYTHHFNFGSSGKFSFQLDDGGNGVEMDYFFIYGPDIRDVLDRYTALTGRPRIPPRSMFGLQLSDKGYPDNPGAEWWKQKVTAHRGAGFPLDHLVLDNTWRAGSGAWSGSFFAWSPERYPDPAAFERWCKQNGLTVTIDLNRNIVSDCEGWKPEFNIPLAEQYIKEGNSTPDYTDPEVRNWLWDLFWSKSLDPALGYPGDGVWIDETDELYPLPDTVTLDNGRTWKENANLYQYFVAQAAVEEGWDKAFGEKKRPYVWIRGMSAGGQRLATYWTGDLACSYNWMKGTVRGMLAAGLSGFPYFNHDAGGFRGGPDDAMYMRWAMEFGSFTPIWRPHGYGENKRWPLDRSRECQDVARSYSEFRYTLMPYIYSIAHEAAQTGMPMARPMLLEFQHLDIAWQRDLQYFWGEQMLVAPVFSGGDTITGIWLPPGKGWYDLDAGTEYPGNTVIDYRTDVESMPVFVRKGAVIPMQPFVLSTSMMQDTMLILKVYSGDGGDFTLYEDDGSTGYCRTGGELRRTHFEYSETQKQLRIHPAEGKYSGASESRSYQIQYYVSHQPPGVQLSRLEDNANIKCITSWDAEKRIFMIETEKIPVDNGVLLKFVY